MLRIKEYSASAVIIDLSNGGIISMASNPSYNPNKFVEGISQKDWDSLLKVKTNH